MEYRLVKVSYTGRIKEGEVFDSTDEETAKKENIYEPKRIYKPMPVVVGEGHLLKGLDEALKDMKEGEEKRMELPPEKAYGPRDTGLVRLVPMKAFREQKMTPVPGMRLELDGRIAKIQTVAGGRVRVDFNSELAGKTLEYDLKVEKEAGTEEEKIKYLIERSFNASEGFETRKKDKSLEVVIPETSYRDRTLLVRKASLAAEVYRFTDVESISFIETWKKKKDDRDKKDDKKDK
ncbi:MAG: peptidylprolyl isomerase [Candidatus Altiarchaeota archaeon]|nr:peptidylprolyl isomerase [Candidatus Altiarchaeota archaeon]